MLLLNVPFAARIGVVVRRRGLDRELAAGVDPRSTPAVVLRAPRLCRRRMRLAIARRLRRTITAADKASSDRSGFAPLARDEILAASDALMDLVRRLEGPGAVVEAMGAALARLLVVDMNSPLAVGAEPGTLHTVVRLATVGLDMSPHHAAGDR